GALRYHVMHTHIRPLFVPLLEIAKGMKEAPFQSKVSWPDVGWMKPAELSTKLQGTISKDMICEKLQFTSDIPDEKQIWFKNWIQIADDNQTKQFLYAVTGSPALNNKPLKINNV